MNRLLWVARHEYWHHVRRRSFQLATFGLPLLVFLFMGMGIFIAYQASQTEVAIGVVDHSGVLAEVSLPLPSDPAQRSVPLQGFADTAAAQAALAAEQITAYVLIPADYLAVGEVEVYGVAQLTRVGQHSLEAALHQGLLAQAQLPSSYMAIVQAPLGQLEAMSIDGSSLHPDEIGGRIIVAIFASLLFMLTILTSSGYLLQALVEEKENRTMELITTSISPEQLIGGKTVGLGLVGFTIAGVWVVASILGWQIGSIWFEPLRAISLSFTQIFVTALLISFGYMLFAGFMVAISAMVPTAQEGQHFTGLVTVIAVLPMIANGLFITNPHGPVPTAMSLFPISAPIAMLLRMLLGDVPIWQLGLSLILLALAAGGMIWLASRIFRMGMLHYGQRLQLRDLLRLGS
ncbi:ABC transporter permease [Candidatus Viridilinea mediisalina]|uniref:ABC-2 type transporter transmembrane domain-containing protein n=1 Tax=Candidatus Viridilinea mediisalina TaxID=2024553 RepID=A0A2A6RJL5_9CHLR|nr:ABC transporter permease [Candidatus Viridilinea mediisalina]PDW03267.1 hypothetical protein CJ255_09795 [Candidatus Viridilinea mediisalina]